MFGGDRDDEIPDLAPLAPLAAVETPWSVDAGSGIGRDWLVLAPRGRGRPHLRRGCPRAGLLLGRRERPLRVARRHRRRHHRRGRGGRRAGSRRYRGRRGDRPAPGNRRGRLARAAHERGAEPAAPRGRAGSSHAPSTGSCTGSTPRRARCAGATTEACPRSPCGGTGSPVIASGRVANHRLRQGPHRRRAKRDRRARLGRRRRGPARALGARAARRRRHRGGGGGRRGLRGELRAGRRGLRRRDRPAALAAQHRVALRSSRGRRGPSSTSRTLAARSRPSTASPGPGVWTEASLAGRAPRVAGRARRVRRGDRHTRATSTGCAASDGRPAARTGSGEGRLAGPPRPARRCARRLLGKGTSHRVQGPLTGTAPARKSHQLSSLTRKIL